MAAHSPMEGEAMSAATVRILVVGHTSPSTLATLQRLEREGWSSHCVNCIAEAEGALKMIRFDVVLAEENIDGGSGYELTDSVLELGGTLFVSIALSEASLWLPVVQRGMLTLGDRALNSSTLQLEVREALSAPSEERAARKARGSVADPAAARDGLEAKRFLPPRRKPSATISVTEDASLRPEPAKSDAVPRGGVPGRHFR
jgi:DNA-binding NtrC family response regulator